MRMESYIAVIIILIVACLIVAYKAGGSYNKGYIDGYKASHQKHKATFYSLLVDYKKAIKEYEEAKFWYNEVCVLYNARLDSLNTSQDNDKSALH